ncbi:hypothetical protein MSG28_003194 [Choristoneura fumiferana]|uniref:Uncharacterized protein n=1 Tax=Choristoneura fumiferana TaxID=7141 RepID=A0ACC0KEM5_CHOFU|nr:hypothetical protein MSG28_003194 [Choristoneura fumiferana]
MKSCQLKFVCILACSPLAAAGRRGRRHTNFNSRLASSRLAGGKSPLLYSIQLAFHTVPVLVIMTGFKILHLFVALGFISQVPKRHDRCIKTSPISAGIASRSSSNKRISARAALGTDGRTDVPPPKGGYLYY